MGAGDAHKVFASGENPARVHGSEILGSICHKVCARLDVTAQFIGGIDLACGVDDDGDIVAVADVDDLLQWERAGVAVSWGQVVDSGGVRANGLFKLVDSPKEAFDYLKRKLLQYYPKPQTWDRKTP